GCYPGPGAAELPGEDHHRCQRDVRSLAGGYPRRPGAGRGPGRLVGGAGPDVALQRLHRRRGQPPGEPAQGGGPHMMAGPTRYRPGLDLGLAQEFTALAVLERTLPPDPGRPGREVSHYAVRHLERFPLGTPYTEVSVRLARLYSGPPLAG